MKNVKVRLPRPLKISLGVMIASFVISLLLPLAALIPVYDLTSKDFQGVSEAAADSTIHRAELATRTGQVFTLVFVASGIVSGILAFRLMNAKRRAEQSSKH